MRKCLTGLFLLVLAAGCATVNVYITFPQEKLEKAAEQIELDLQKDLMLTPPPAAPRSGQSRVNPLKWLGPAPAYAQTISSEVKTRSPLIGEIMKQRRERLSDIQVFKDKGTLGEDREGLLDVRSSTGLDRESRLKQEQLVKEENQDRLAMYREIVKINSMPSAELKNVQAAFAKIQRKLAQVGEWIQEEDGTWTQKKEVPDKKNK
ncbi:MAG TPA: DUF1318 domain-containing protein [bacterium]|uniref:DUF1318 domain-containing protein n=1 Tax=candidate division TA06 bacterium ADurb.Bin417 TaxID=1852828 RepID=A0A1V5MAZ3_UNCT6|nr:MAG: hypothetical protein BWY73_01324 [candidate division TA06 bacterium ADurb.Bin417]HNQ35605.1 DUF1318 domain-containing protein [bacterium]HNS47982.1 DUF1318 domain-containing protein [bacterium]